jgi:deazaflavin-dependent oxidoreductase (nitroreductase family)
MENVNPPTSTERLFNKLFGFLVGLGLGLPHNFLLQVRGRKTGRVHSTPVDVLVLAGRQYLVAPRGHTAWVQNALASGTVALKKGRRRDDYRVRPLRADEKPAVLKAYLDRFKLTVQRYFPVQAGAPETAFRSLVDRYPVFELEPEA